jgi:NAD+ diphosphatase
MYPSAFRPFVAPPSEPGDEGLWFCVLRGQVLVHDETGAIPTRPPQVEHAARHFLGFLDDVPLWAVELQSEPRGDDYRLVHLRQLYGSIPEPQWIMAGRAEQISTFDRTHRFCGQCGGPTQPHPTDRARQCVACGHMAFPRLTPAVIMRVTRGEEILLAHGRLFPGRFFSTLAGFVEPGEDLEHAVQREVYEEVAIRIGRPTYFGSQPWPFPHSLMIGFTAEWEDGEIAIQEDEIVEAGWFTADALPPCPLGGMSIAGWMIQDWLDRQAR